MGAALVGHNLKVVSKKKLKNKDMVDLAATNIVGLGLIGAAAEFT